MSVAEAVDRGQVYGRPEMDVNAAVYAAGVIDGTIQITETPPSVTPVEIRRGMQLDRVRVHSNNAFSDYTISTLGRCCVTEPKNQACLVEGAEPCEGAVFSGFLVDEKGGLVFGTECPQSVSNDDLPCQGFGDTERRRYQGGMYVTPFTLGDGFVDALVDRALPETIEDLGDIVRDVIKNFAYREKVQTFLPWPDEKDVDNEPRTHHAQSLVDMIKVMNDSNVEHMGDDFSVSASVVDIAQKLFGDGLESANYQGRARNIALAWLELRTMYRVATETRKSY